MPEEGTGTGREEGDVLGRGQKDNNVVGALTLHVANKGLILPTHMVPCILSGVIAECRIRSKP